MFVTLMISQLNLLIIYGQILLGKIRWGERSCMLCNRQLNLFSVVS